MPETINAFKAMCLFFAGAAAVLSIPFLMNWLEKKERSNDDN